MATKRLFFDRIPLCIRICVVLLIILIVCQRFNSFGINYPSYLFQNDIDEAFITFTDSQQVYIQLLDVLLDSIHLFSTRRVIVFTVDFNLNLNKTHHPRALTRRISQKDCGRTIFACKILAIVSSRVKFGVQLDSDSVVNYNIDMLFDMLHVWPYDLPLASKHPNDPKNYLLAMKEHHVKHPSTPYMHATFAWTYRAYPFLRRVLRLMQREAFMGENFDETAMNIMLWKAKANHVLCKYDPYGPLYIEKYEKPVRAPFCHLECDGIYLVFHGQKSSAISKSILERIIKLGPQWPYVQTTEGLKRFNDSDVTCCHPSATKTSPLHPLLCEYDWPHKSA